MAGMKHVLQLNVKISGRTWLTVKNLRKFMFHVECNLLPLKKFSKGGKSLKPEVAGGYDEVR